LGVIKTRVSKAEAAAKSNARTLPVERNPLSKQLAHANRGTGKYIFDVQFSRPAFEVCALVRQLGENSLSDYVEHFAVHPFGNYRIF